MDSELLQITQEMGNMSIEPEQFQYHIQDIEKKNNKLIKPFIDCNDFSHDFLVNCFEHPDWEWIKYDIAYKIGKLGDINFYNNFIVADYIKTLDDNVLIMTLRGASEMGHVHLIYMISQYMDVEQLGVAINVFNSGDMEASYDLIRNFDDNNMVMYALGAAGKLDIIKMIIQQSETDMIIPLEGAAKYGKLNVIKYYFEELKIGHAVDIYNIMCLILDGYHFECFEYLLEKVNIDLSVIYNRLLVGFDFDKYIPLIDEYFKRFCNDIQ
jgi:hypothetical protein